MSQPQDCPPVGIRPVRCACPHGPPLQAALDRGGQSWLICPACGSAGEAWEILRGLSRRRAEAITPRRPRVPAGAN